MAWWLERRLSLLAELACDEACLATLGDRESYARLLLEMASVVDRPMAWFGYVPMSLTMAAGSHLRQSGRTDFEGRREPLRGLCLTWMGRDRTVRNPSGAVCGNGRVRGFQRPLLPPALAEGRTAPAPPPPRLLAQARPAAPSPTRHAAEFGRVASIRPAVLPATSRFCSQAQSEETRCLPPPSPGGGGQEEAFRDRN